MGTITQNDKNTVIRHDGLHWIAENKVLDLVGKGSTVQLAYDRLEAAIHQKATVVSGNRNTHWLSSSGSWTAPKDMSIPYLLNVIRLLQRSGRALQQLWEGVSGVTTPTETESILRYYPVYKELLADAAKRGLVLFDDPSASEIKRAADIVASRHRA